MAPFSHLSSHHSLSPLPLTTPPHHSPTPLRSYSPLLTPFPIITSLHSPHLTTHLFITLFTPHPTTLKRTRKKSFFYVSKPLQGLPITQNIISDHFLQKKFWDKIDQKLEYDGGGDAHVRNCARAMSSIHFSTCNILPLKKTLISHFRVLFVFKINFSDIFPMYLGTTKATSKKNQVQRCFRFPGI